MKSFMIKYLLILLLFSSSQCDFLDDILCGIQLSPLEDSGKTGKLDFHYIQTVSTNCLEYILSHLTEKMRCLYEFGKEAIDNGKKIFNIELDFSTILYKEEILVYRDANIDFLVKFLLDSETTIKTNDDSSFTIKVENEVGKNEIDINNPLVSKIEELTGFNLEEISLNIESKILALPDAKISVNGKFDTIEISYSTSKEINSTVYTGSTSFIIKLKEKGGKEPQLAVSLESIKEILNQFINTEKMHIIIIYTIFGFIVQKILPQINIT